MRMSPPVDADCRMLYREQRFVNFQASLTAQEGPQPGPPAPRPAQRVAEGGGGRIARGRLARQRLTQHALQFPPYILAGLVKRRRVLRGLTRQNRFGGGSLARRAAQQGEVRR